MTGTLRKQRLRNPYREALRTYLQWPLILVALFEAMMALIAGLVLAIEPVSEITFDGVFPIGLCLMLLGIVVTEHLNQMLGSPRSRVTPGLHTTHLRIAGAMTAVVGVGLPCLIAGLTVGFGERGLAIVALTLSGLTVPAMLSRRIPFGLVYFAAAVFAVILMLLRQTVGAREMPVSSPSSIALLAASLASLFALKTHFLQLQEETPVYSRRGLLRALWGPQAAIGDSRTEEVRQWSSYRVPLPRNLRALGGKSPGAGENLLRRGEHWHAASQLGWNMLREGMFLGLMVAIMTIFPAVRSLGNMASGLCLAAPLAGLVPAFALGLQPAVRSRVAYEFLRPFSRTQHVQAVGLILVVFLTAEALEIMFLPLTGFWLVASTELWSRQPVWPLAAGLSAIPLFLGVGLTNLRESEAFWAILASWIAYPLFLWLAASCEGKGEGWPLLGLCTLMAAVGLATMRGTYRSWLERDVA